MRILTLLTLLLTLPLSTVRAERLAVLNIEGSSESLYLTDLVRGYASRHTEYLVLTKENIETLVPPSALTKCVGQCEVEVGRILGSHRVISGVMFGSKLVLKLHDTTTGALLKSVVIEGDIESRLESSFLELMGLEETSFEELEARYVKLREEIERKKNLKAKQERLDRLKEHMGGLKSSHSWVIDSHIQGQRFKYVPDRKSPSLHLQGEWRDWYGVALGDRYRLKDGAFTHSSRANDYWGSHTTTNVYLDEVTATKDGIGYDSEGRALVPMVIKERYGNDTTKEVIYAIEDLLIEDFHQGQQFQRSAKRILYGIPLFLATTGLAINRFAPKGAFYGGKRPNLFGGLVASNLVLCGLWVWLTTDTRKYNYPQYKEIFLGDHKTTIYRAGTEDDR